MKRFIEGESRSQITLLPESLDDYISEDNPVRAVEAFIDELDLCALGFAGVRPAVTGRPSYHPSILLKLYLYGYLNRLQSSRRLERECQRNVELMWLTGKLAPDFKTIADFRHDNGQAIRNVCREFVLLCRRLNLFTQAIVAIDGSKFKAVNAHDRNFTCAKVDKRVKEIERSIDEYLVAIETADRNPSEVTETKTAHLHRKIETLKREMRDLKGMQAQLEASGGQVSLTDPDARAMATSTSRGLVGYNVQTAVETEHHLIVAHEVTNVGSDRRQLAKMAKQAQEIMPDQELQAIADRGYFNGEEVLACDQAGITTYVSKPMTSEAKAEGRFDKSDFVYQHDTDTYRCPAGSQLIRRFARVEAGHLIHRYWSSDCPRCPIKAQCTPSDYRRVSRWEHEAVLEAMQKRLDGKPNVMRIRRQTVEHPFGTIKFWMGARHFLMRTLAHVQTEMSLHVLAYNLKRVIQIVGMTTLMAAIKA
ncbi:IS1182 family transposase [Candidatus Accumulibacter vicinus]|uniref:Transposase DDE domain protein n=1 Tax=Candidatus Accumulibacter vicinus TaxID=2954382 RepID=A0A084XUS1_9PROT|nr:IS1182 family transposase [Candidatus Accumulibacter vicinus]KFB66215.1 MAG: Transposase DDE domain protein [Candidatus Accumulibacter vicinus]